ncbi:alpha/beta hydrolase family protein [Constantimarinum furrinae]|uniref:Lysophospholipase n=1 Tax=Constantimarinum furrinae TaxID=2562285 RepID=A0A7G8PT93_9FLAO|nr:alpha/beta fold hydrolase [Constantimarinum furrinae]QNJ97559.1 Lysophospholipase [Constantimarinum furrinae]
MIIEKNLVLAETSKKPLLYDVFYTPSDNEKPLIIFCHGFKGFKDWGVWDLVAKQFANAGFFFVKFNFSHNGGTLEQPVDFPDPETFAQNNFSIELDDLDRMLDHLQSSIKWKNRIDFNRLGLLGHSRGGSIALIKTEEDSRIKKVATWAAVSDFEARFQVGTEAFNIWRETGISYIENSRTKQQLPLNFQFYEDFIQHKTRLTISRAVKQIKVPQLIIHGSEDPTVSIKEAKAIHSWNPESKLEIINGADHVFGASHPWNKENLPHDLMRATKLTANFFQQPNK